MVGMICMGLMKGEGRNVDEISSRVWDLDMGYSSRLLFSLYKGFFMPQYCFHFQRMMCW
jgi:hypothetical protein